MSANESTRLSDGKVALPGTQPAHRIQQQRPQLSSAGGASKEHHARHRRQQMRQMNEKKKKGCGGSFHLAALQRFTVSFTSCRLQPLTYDGNKSSLKGHKKKKNTHTQSEQRGHAATFASPQIGWRAGRKDRNDAYTPHGEINSLDFRLGSPAHAHEETVCRKASSTGQASLTTSHKPQLHW